VKLKESQKNFDIVLESMSREGAQDESASLALICQGTIEIAKELAILNDYLKGKTENEKCESEASLSD
jgi:hypothetical protein